MKRREVIKSGIVAGVAGATNINSISANINAAAEGSHFYELRTYQLRNDIKPNRLRDFLQQHWMPALKRLDIGPIGCFTVASGMYTPSLLILIDYKSLAEMQSVMERLAGDREFAKAAQEFEAAAEMPYVRYESTLLRAFEKHQKIEIPPIDDRKPGRLFELRTYESRSSFSLKNKMDFFNQEEIRIFRDCGFAPVFFGEAITGTRLPALTYMVGFENMEARDKAWATFIDNADFKKFRVKPGWTDPEAVSNIYGSFLRPTPFSQIR
jgi:hypothetical protein